MADEDNVVSHNSQQQNIAPSVAAIANYLDDLKVQYKLVTYTLSSKNGKDIWVAGKQISLSQILRAVLFKNSKRYLLVITAMQSLLDYVVLSRELCCDDLLCELQSPYFAYYEQTLQSYCPFPKHLNITAVLDSRTKEILSAEDVIYLPIGQSNTLVQLSWKEYFAIHAGIKTIDCSIELAAIVDKPELQLSNVNIVKRMNKLSLTEHRMKERVRTTFEMPVMPTMANQLLKLRINPVANAAHLGKLIEQDPSLSAQLISWACSSYYGYEGKITSVEDAIIKVLGFDLVMNIALGIAIGQVMNVSNIGKLGLIKHWRHSLYAASLIELIVKNMPVTIKPYRGLAYLCGLLHNFGHLLLGQVFPQQFHILNQMILANPYVSILAIEQYLFDTNHQKIGAWLMNIWHMPEELTLTVAHHHDGNYLDGVGVIYANLVFTANRLLARYEIGDEFLDTSLSEPILKNLQLTAAELENIFQEFWNNKEGLDNIINSFASSSNLNNT